MHARSNPRVRTQNAGASSYVIRCVIGASSGPAPPEGSPMEWRRSAADESAAHRGHTHGLLQLRRWQTLTSPNSTSTRRDLGRPVRWKRRWLHTDTSETVQPRSKAQTALTGQLWPGFDILRGVSTSHWETMNKQPRAHASRLDSMD